MKYCADVTLTSDSEEGLSEKAAEPVDEMVEYHYRNQTQHEKAEYYTEE